MIVVYAHKVHDDIIFFCLPLDLASYSSMNFLIYVWLCEMLRIRLKSVTLGTLLCTYSYRYKWNIL